MVLIECVHGMVVHRNKYPKRKRDGEGEKEKDDRGQILRLAVQLFLDAG